MRLKKLLASIVLGALSLLAALAVTPVAPALAGPATQRWVGFYVPGAPADITPLASVESVAGARAAVSNYFQNTSQGFTLTQATNASSHGSIPLTTLEFWDPAKGVSQPAYSLKSIADGTWDTYLHTYARSAKAFGKTVWLRPLHEMNGDWYPWGGTVNGNTPAGFVAAWRHIHDIFASEGAANVKFVWCPNVDSVPATPTNAIARYWPGDGYVDYLALDGYNFGGSSSSWRSFSSVFGPAYAAVTVLSAKPVFIAETACGTVGGDKAAWIADMFSAIPKRFGRIVGVTWFDAAKERDWRVDSCASARIAFSAGVTTWGRSLTVSARIAGADRYETAAMAVASAFPTGSVAGVVLASGQDSPDALSASGLAGTIGGPLLLTRSTDLPGVTLTQIQRVTAGATNPTVSIVGGPGAVSRTVADQLAAAGLTVVRYSGLDRYATAAAVASAIHDRTGTTPSAFVVRGDSFADALAVGPLAYARRMPVLLTKPDALPAVSSDAVRSLGISSVIIAGGTGAVSDSVASALAALCGMSSPVRLAGSDRYATAATVASYGISQGWATRAFVGVACGSSFPDALAAGPACGQQGGVLVLTTRDAVPQATAGFLAEHDGSVDPVTVYGGASAVSDSIAAGL